jgi:hypothetical protein
MMLMGVPGPPCPDRVVGERAGMGTVRRFAVWPRGSGSSGFPSQVGGEERDG